MCFMHGVCVGWGKKVKQRRKKERRQKERDKHNHLFNPSGGVPCCVRWYYTSDEDCSVNNIQARVKKHNNWPCSEWDLSQHILTVIFNSSK
jgi:hypothetical protein